MSNSGVQVGDETAVREADVIGQKEVVVSEIPLSESHRAKLFNFRNKPSMLKAADLGVDLEKWDDVDKRIKTSVDSWAVTGRQKSGELYIAPAFNAEALSTDGKKVNILMRDIGENAILEEDVLDEDGGVVESRYWQKSDSDELNFKVRQKSKTALALDQVTHEQARTALEGGKLLVKLSDMEHAGFAKYDIRQDQSRDKSQESRAETSSGKTVVRVGTETYLKIVSAGKVLYEGEDGQRLDKDGMYQKMAEKRVGKVSLTEGGQVLLSVDPKHYSPVGETQFDTGASAEIVMVQDPRMVEGLGQDALARHVDTVALITANLEQMARDGVLDASCFDSGGKFSFGSTEAEIQKNMAVTEIANNLINLNGVEVVDLGSEGRDSRLIVTPILTDDQKHVVVERSVIQHGDTVVGSDKIRLLAVADVDGLLKRSDSGTEGTVSEFINGLSQTQDKFTYFDEIKGFSDVVT